MERDIKPTYDELESYVENLQKQLADAQATIAALEETILKMGENAAVVAKDAMAAKEQVAALQGQVRELEDDRSAWKEIAQDWSAAAKLAEQPEKFYEGYSAAVMNAMQALLTKARAEFTQRTVELEAAKAELEQERVRLASCLIAAEGGTKDIVKQGDYGWSPAYQATLNLQAELERVRADNKALDEWRADVTVSLQRPGGAFFVDVPQHIKDLVKERDDLRTLLLALPKVEGAVVVSNGYVKDSTRCHALFGADEDAALYAALLQHRQGMEG